MTTTASKPLVPAFSSYQKLVVAILAFLQFTIILDFMLLSPLGAVLMPALQISPAQFGLVVSAYAFSAGLSGLLTAGFADRFDRKKMLLFFYAGFLVGTFLCGIANSYHFLLFARIVTGLFGGVIGSIAFAIITDLFPYEMRGRVMGIVQTAFAASQVLGIPFGLFLSNRSDWHAPFLLIVGFGVLVGILIALRLQPLREHLKIQSDKTPFRHLLHTFSQPRYVQGFAATALMMVGGFMLMPFGSQYSVHNLGVSLDQLPMVYFVPGLFSIVTGPLIGRISDRFGKLPTFMTGSIGTIIMVIIYTRLGPTPLWGVIVVSILMFTGVSARMISSSALMSALPAPADRGAYMSASSSIQQISGGIAAAIGGLIVSEAADGKLEHFEQIGNVTIGTSLLTIFMIYMISRYLHSRIQNV